MSLTNLLRSMVNLFHKTALLISLILIITSCSPQKKLARLLERNPELKEKQIVLARGTVKTTFPGVVGDTVIKIYDSVPGDCPELKEDTAVVQEENLTARSWISGDSLYLEAECDTVYQEVPFEVPIEVEKIVYRKPRDGLSWWRAIAIIEFLLIIVIIYIVLRARK